METVLNHYTKLLLTYTKKLLNQVSTKVFIFKSEMKLN